MNAVTLIGRMTPDPATADAFAASDHCDHIHVALGGRWDLERLVERKTK